MKQVEIVLASANGNATSYNEAQDGKYNLFDGR